MDLTRIIISDENGSILYEGFMTENCDNIKELKSLLSQFKELSGEYTLEVDHYKYV